MALTKADLIDNLLEVVPFKKEVGVNFVESFLEEIKRTLESGESVKLSGFGNFELRDKKERPGRNPKTGEDIPIAARRVVTFKAGHKLKRRIDAVVPSIQN